MRAFVVIRQYVLASTNTEKELVELKKQIKSLCKNVESLGKDHEEYNQHFDDIYLALSQLAARQKQNNKPRNPIGFNVDRKEK